MKKTLPKSFYRRDTKEVAIDLLGKILVRRTQEGTVKGKIVETYVYFTYGMHYLLNVVTEEEGKAGAVLIRAVEPKEGIELMKRRRNFCDLKNLTNGPAKLTQAFDITTRENGVDLTGRKLWIEEGSGEKFEVVSTSRIGIRAGKEAKLRFYIKGNEFVSKK